MDSGDNGMRDWRKLGTTRTQDIRHEGDKAREEARETERSRTLVERFFGKKIEAEKPQKTSSSEIKPPQAEEANRAEGQKVAARTAQTKPSSSDNQAVAKEELRQFHQGFQKLLATQKAPLDAAARAVKEVVPSQLASDVRPKPLAEGVLPPARPLAPATPAAPRPAHANKNQKQPENVREQHQETQELMHGKQQPQVATAESRVALSSAPIDTRSSTPLTDKSERNSTEKTGKKESTERKGEASAQSAHGAHASRGGSLEELSANVSADAGGGSFENALPETDPSLLTFNETSGSNADLKGKAQVFSRYVEQPHVQKKLIEIGRFDQQLDMGLIALSQRIIGDDNDVELADFLKNIYGGMHA